MKPILPVILAMAAATGAAHAATATPGDRAFVAKVGQGGMFEVNAGKLAATKGSTQDVRDFAAMEVHDHMLVGARLKTVAAAEGIAVPTTADAAFAAKLKTLEGLSGPAFDRAYMSEMATLHDGDGAAFLKVSTAGATPEIRAMGAETHLIVARHIGAIHGAPPPAR